MLIEYLSKHHFADIRTIRQELELTGKEADEILLKSRNEGKIEMIGRRYFLKGAVVPKEMQHDAILDYIKKISPLQVTSLQFFLA